MKNVIILREARKELVEAMDYYDEKHFGLGLDFECEIKASVKNISQFPENVALRDDNTRRYLVKRFPYVVIYVYSNDQIWVISIAHCKRKPEYWKQRLANIRGLQ